MENLADENEKLKEQIAKIEKKNSEEKSIIFSEIHQIKIGKIANIVCGTILSGIFAFKFKNEILAILQNLDFANSAIFWATIAPFCIAVANYFVNKKGIKKIEEIAAPQNF